jgi:hypothetical protein
LSETPARLSVARPGNLGSESERQEFPRRGNSGRGRLLRGFFHDEAHFKPARAAIFTEARDACFGGTLESQKGRTP